MMAEAPLYYTEVPKAHGSLQKHFHPMAIAGAALATIVLTATYHASTSSATRSLYLDAAPLPPSVDKATTSRLSGVVSGLLLSKRGRAANIDMSSQTFAEMENEPRSILNEEEDEESTPTSSIFGVAWLVGIPLVMATLVGIWRRRVHKPWAMAAMIGLPFHSGRGRKSMSLNASVDPLERPASFAPGTVRKVGESFNTEINPVLLPKSFTGELLNFSLHNNPQSFGIFVKDRIEMLSDERRQMLEEFKQISFSSRKLYRRINEVKVAEQQTAVEDILYYSVLHSFGALGISPIEPQQLQDKARFTPINVDLRDACARTEEEKVMVDTHLRYILGVLQAQPIMNLCTFQVFEIFGTSLLFGYFLRRVSHRFALARGSGLIPQVLTPLEMRQMLEHLFESATSKAEDMDAAQPLDQPKSWGRQKTLKEYVDTLDPKDLMDSMLMSQESANVVQNYIVSLFGDVGSVARRIREAINQAGLSKDSEEYRQTMSQMMASQQLGSLNISYNDVRRLALEAVAFGCFLKDAETSVELVAEQPLLRPAQFMSII